MDLRDKYPITQWVLSKDYVSAGDRVAFYCEQEAREVHAVVVGFPPIDSSLYIICQREGAKDSEMINILNTIVFKVDGFTVADTVCTCGAKHTSNPRYHLRYCELAKKAS